MRASVLVVLALAACGIKADTSAPARPPPARAAKSDKPAAPWVFSVTPGPWRGRRTFIEPGRLYEIDDRLRYAWVEGEAVVAGDLPATPIVGWDSSSAGFLFLTADGAVYRADSFAGPLAYVPGFVDGYVDVGVLGDTGFACTRDGKLATMPMSGDSVLKRRGESCLQIRSDDDELLVRGRAEVLRWNAQTRRFTPVGRFERDPPAPPVELTDEHTAARVRAEEVFAERYGKIIAASRVYRTPDGYLFQERYRGIADLDGRAIPQVVGMDCEVFTPGGRVSALCTPRHQLLRDGDSIYAWTQGRWKHHSRLPDRHENHRYAERGDVVVGTNGSMVQQGSCGPGEDDEEEEEGMEPDGVPRALLCWYDGTDFRTVMYESPRIPDAPENDEEEGEEEEGHGYALGYEEEGAYAEIDLLEVHRQWLVMYDEDHELRLLNLRSGGTGRPVDYSMFGRLEHRPSFIGNVLRGVVETGEGLLVVDLLDGRFVLGPVPEAAVSVDFASRGRGMAAGRNLDELWTTVDGGATWTQQTVPVDGDAAAVELEDVHCTNAACTAAPVIWLAPDVLEDLDYAPPRLVAPTTAIEFRRRLRRRR